MNNIKTDKIKQRLSKPAVVTQDKVRFKWQQLAYSSQLRYTWNCKHSHYLYCTSQTQKVIYDQQIVLTLYAIAVNKYSHLSTAFTYIKPVYCCQSIAVTGG